MLTHSARPFPAALGWSLQEDYAEAVHKSLVKFLEEDDELM